MAEKRILLCVSDGLWPYYTWKYLERLLIKQDRFFSDRDVELFVLHVSLPPYHSTVMAALTEEEKKKSQTIADNHSKSLLSFYGNKIIETVGHLGIMKEVYLLRSVGTWKIAEEIAKCAQHFQIDEIFIGSGGRHFRQRGDRADTSISRHVIEMCDCTVTVVRKQPSWEKTTEEELNKMIDSQSLEQINVKESPTKDNPFFRYQLISPEAIEREKAIKASRAELDAEKEKEKEEELGERREGEEGLSDEEVRRLRKLTKGFTRKNAVFWKAKPRGDFKNVDESVNYQNIDARKILVQKKKTNVTVWKDRYEMPIEKVNADERKVQDKIMEEKKFQEENLRDKKDKFENFEMMEALQEREPEKISRIGEAVEEGGMIPNPRKKEEEEKEKDWVNIIKENEVKHQERGGTEDEQKHDIVEREGMRRNREKKKKEWKKEKKGAEKTEMADKKEEERKNLKERAPFSRQERNELAKEKRADVKAEGPKEKNETKREKRNKKESYGNKEKKNKEKLNQLKKEGGAGIEEFKDIHKEDFSGIKASILRSDFQEKKRPIKEEEIVEEFKEKSKEDWSGIKATINRDEIRSREGKD